MLLYSRSDQTRICIHSHAPNSLVVKPPPHTPKMYLKNLPFIWTELPQLSAAVNSGEWPWIETAPLSSLQRLMTVMMLVFRCSVINISHLILLLQAESVSQSVCLCVWVLKGQEVVQNRMNYWHDDVIVQRTEPKWDIRECLYMNKLRLALSWTLDSVYFQQKCCQ